MVVDAASVVLPLCLFALSSQSSPRQPQLQPLSGWSEVVDTRQTGEGPRCSQCMYLPPSERNLATAPSSSSSTSVVPVDTATPGGAARTADDAEAAATTLRQERILYFHILTEDNKMDTAAGRLLRSLTIFPSLTLLNATFAELDLCVFPTSSVSLRDTGERPLKRPPPVSALRRLQQQQQQPMLEVTLTRQSVFFVYEVPPDKPLSLSLRFAVLDGAQWSPVVPDFLSSEVSIVSSTSTFACLLKTSRLVCCSLLLTTVTGALCLFPDSAPCLIRTPSMQLLPKYCALLLAAVPCLLLCLPYYEEGKGAPIWIHLCT